MEIFIEINIVANIKRIVLRITKYVINLLHNT